jgi:3-oxoacyl-(acyl-carrier-protein) synthase
MSRLTITGIGSVTPIGIGKEELRQSLDEGASGLARIRKFPSPLKTPSGEIRDPGLDKNMAARFRRVAAVSKYALSAVDMAIKDRGLPFPGGNETALVMGLTHGALTYTEAFHGSLLREERGSASPLFFSDSVLNAPAGNVSICYGIRGPVHTLVGGPATSLKALMLSMRMANSGEVAGAIAVSSEELNELSFSCYSRLGMTAISEGAGAVFIEKDGPETTSRYCYLSGAASRCCPSDPAEALQGAIQQSLDEAGLTTRDIDAVMTDTLPQALTRFSNATPIVTLAHLTGSAFSVNAMWHIILASMSLQGGALPLSVIVAGRQTGDLRHIMVCASESDGVGAAVVLSKT